MTAKPTRAAVRNGVLRRRRSAEARPSRAAERAVSVTPERLHGSGWCCGILCQVAFQRAR
ncbi:hypothetical protein GCM10022256_29400 [Frondihabitans peucedani]|uniref:Uncharacterized protein n=1 Tax=Frondihabitans peucedani TaxID=598626 RepID=A0ABP8E553_9MICO